jgi:hypothetical protein
MPSSCKFSGEFGLGIYNKMIKIENELIYNTFDATSDYDMRVEIVEEKKFDEFGVSNLELTRLDPKGS